MKDFYEDFHEFAVEWMESYIAFFVDGKMYANFTKQSNNVGFPHYLILNTAIEGGWPHNVTEKTVFPTYHKIDYVKIMDHK